MAGGSGRRKDLKLKEVGIENLLQSYVMHGGKCSMPISLDIEKLILGKYSQFYNYCQNH